jgi:uncharacterized protein YwlG (UPF0340 family)
MPLDPEVRKQLNPTARAMATQCLKHLQRALIKEALAVTEVRLEGAQLRFDTIPNAIWEETVAAYKRILDDPVALEALKKELPS